MTRKPRIKPPPVPPCEDPLVTIGNQEKQIDMLLKRIEALTAQVDTYARDCRKAESTSDMVQDQLRLAQAELVDAQESYIRVKGWQDCAREILQQMVEK